MSLPVHPLGATCAGTGHGMGSTWEPVCITSGQLKRNSGGTWKGHTESQHFQRQLENYLHLKRKRKTKKRHTDCVPLQKRYNLAKVIISYIGWTRQSFNKRLHWRAEHESVKLQKKCQPLKISRALHHLQVRHSTATRGACTSVLQEKLSQLSRKQQVPHQQGWDSSQRHEQHQPSS